MEFDRELKVLDTTFGSITVPIAGTAIMSPNLVAQGITKNQRVGRQFNIVHLGLKFVLTMPNQSSIATAADAFRLIVYLDKQANGALAAVTDVLTTASLFSFYNIDNIDRFEIIDDSTFSFSSPSFDSTPVTGGACPVYKHVIRDYDLSIPIEYSGTTGVIGGLKSNNLGFFWLSLAGVSLVGGQSEIQFFDNKN